MGIIAGGHVISGGTPVLDTGDGHILTIDGVPGDGTVEIQDVDDGDATSGDYKLRVFAQNGAVMGTTVAIDEGVAGSVVKTALDAIPGVTVSVAGTGTVADPYVITFDAPGGNLPLMTIVDDTTAGGAGAAVAANQAGVAGTFANIVIVGGLVKNNATGNVYENDGTRAVPTYTRIDTV